MKTTIDTFSDSIALILEDCSRAANRANEETLDRISKEALGVVRDNAPEAEGIYKKGLRRKRLKMTGMNSNTPFMRVERNHPFLIF